MIEYYTIGIIALLAAMSPGPDFFIVAKHAFAHSRKSAILASLGIGFGIIIHSTYCVLGLALVISQSLLIFSLIKYLGAAYLIYLGIKSLFSKSSHIKIEAKQTKPFSAWSAFRDGLLTNVLNPKCTLFMLSIFTLVVKPHTPHLIQASYGFEIMVISVVWFSFLAYGLTTRIIKSKIEKIQHVVSKLIGGVLIALGIVVIFESR
jgi:RhtB (resistance to homoserine/threonine) family protein